MLFRSGKDNTRQQSAMWQAMLMAAGIEPSEKIVVNGFVLGGDGRKMSKSIGNVIDPLDVIETYGAETLRYVVCREISPFEDSPVDMERIHNAYTAHLVNGLGNLVSRIMNMAETHLDGPVEVPHGTIPEPLRDALNSFQLQAAADIVWEKVAELDLRIQSEKPFQVVKEDTARAQEMIKTLVVDLYAIGEMIRALMPETSTQIKELVEENKKPAEPLFPRIDRISSSSD